MLKDKQVVIVDLLADLPTKGNRAVIYLVRLNKVLYEWDGTNYVVIISPGMITAAINAHVLAYH